MVKMKRLSDDFEVVLVSVHSPVNAMRSEVGGVVSTL